MVKPPIIVRVLDEDSIEVYAKARAAECSMEAIDVETGLYVAYDCEGRKLKIIPDGYVGRLYLSDDPVSFIGEVRPRLLKHLAHVVSDINDLREAPFDLLLSTTLATKSEPKTLSQALKDLFLGWFKKT